MSDLTELWKKHLDNLNQLRATSLELMCHPDATVEQLNEVRAVLVRTMRLHYETQEKVRERWPRFKSFPTLEKR